MDSRIRDVLLRGIRLLEPPPTRPAFEWANEKRIFPASHAEPGPYRSKRTPWIEELTRRVMRIDHDMVVFCCGSQMAKTDGFLMNVIGHRLDEDPVPILYLGPTERNVQSISKDRLSKMIMSVPTLYEGLAKGKSNSITSKYINGVRITLGWAGSATEPASHSVGIAIVDEYDRMRALSKEGDIVGLVTPRVAAYADGKIIVTSTPLEGDIGTEVFESGLTHWSVAEEVGSPSWNLWQAGTRHEWAWPCPDCGTYFIARMDLLNWPEDASPAQAKKMAVLACPHCGSGIRNELKGEMNRRGVFVAPGQSITKEGELVGKEEPNPIASFWASGLCSTWKANTFGNLAFKLAKAYKSGTDETLRTVINTGFGECFSPIMKNASWVKVAQCESDYQFGEVPKGVRFLVMGSDVAMDRIDWVIRGFGKNYESWLIDRGEVHGATDRPEVFRDLEKIEERTYDGHQVLVHGIDSGYRADNVYEFSNEKPHLRQATKGRDVLQSGIIRNKPKGLNTYVTSYSTDMAKSWVHARLDWSKTEPGKWHVPEGIDTEYCKQIVSERRVVRTGRNPTWKRLRTNHKFDCESICYVMARMVGPNFFVAGATSRSGAPRRQRRVVSSGVAV